MSEQEVIFHVPNMMNKHWVEYPWSIWNDVEANTVSYDVILEASAIILM